MFIPGLRRLISRVISKAEEGEWKGASCNERDA
ncbi:hypothetical protein SAMN05192539_1006208 [Paraburkholderia diazotrophica]|uniref:Uncharacterized protein n=1 Tax=Paraburkholderia diazotrophica TaxID=667676 RepID=A0A1H6W6S1_9BURK|nr:hypothetical protein SAMN05192539_1006208 [Paraburkholderia diazotrophica]